ncbi:hypothetical protein PGT21_004819 [Puccinia graminis f. sp. tritici]|uniref:Uncharacterized protein n=1 Tax=Puccinia graminis f. sp. tritici TaxID=56615 RepID=A0A5B0NIH2_PUCGR|nr:hypothetical protein PGT21_004819 [Puccinia graminis f. sp. tritici]
MHPQNLAKKIPNATNTLRPSLEQSPTKLMMKTASNRMDPTSRLSKISWTSKLEICAAQMDLFHPLMAFNVSKHPTTAGITTHIGDILNEMETIWMPFTCDRLAGLVLQNGLASEPELQQEFDHRIEHELQSATVEDPPPPMNFEEMVGPINTIQRQLRLQNFNQTLTAMQTPLIMQAKAGLCWQCRYPDHMRARISGPGRSSNHARILMGPSSYAPNGFQSFYPIVIPPDFTGVYPQPQPSHHQQTPLPANAGLEIQPRLADYYRPPQYHLQWVSQQSESIRSQKSRHQQATTQMASPRPEWCIPPPVWKF